jgi:hypothetical protein
VIAVDLNRPGTERTVIVHCSPPRAGHPVPLVKPLGTIFRACELCSHSVACTGRLMCGRAAGQQAGPPEPLEAARAAHGSCGPNARHLDMPGWH